MSNILDQYVNTAPTGQSVIDIFAGEWSSKLPESSGLVTLPGNAALFEDARVTWGVEKLDGVNQKTVLELGPLEAGHTYMLHEAGASEIVSVEGNTKAYLKCLCIKELFALERAHFLLGDFVPMLENETRKFDVCWASGVLYHVVDPVRLLENIAGLTDNIFLWTHYYDPKISAVEGDRNRFGSAEKVSWNGREFELYQRFYGEALKWGGFCGGSRPYARWMTRDGILDCLDMLGFKSIQIGFEAPTHQHGPCFALCARR